VPSAAAGNRSNQQAGQPIKHILSRTDRVLTDRDPNWPNVFRLVGVVLC